MTCVVHDSAELLLPYECIESQMCELKPEVLISTCGLEAAHMALALGIALLCVPLESEQLDVAFRLYDAYVAEIVRVESGSSAQDLVRAWKELTHSAQVRNALHELSVVLHGIDPVSALESALTAMAVDDETRDAPLFSSRWSDDEITEGTLYGELARRIALRQTHGASFQSARFLLSWTLGCLGPLLFLILVVRRAFSRVFHSILAWLRGRHHEHDE